MEGKADVVVSFDAWTAGKVRPTTHEITVRAPRSSIQLLPVTERLVKTLPHPNRNVGLHTVMFSPKGDRLLGAGYPSGIAQIWDTKTWKEIARLDTSPGGRSSFYFAQPTPDWKTILVDSMSRKVVRKEKDGKVSERLQIDGRIDRYDATTGKLQDTIPFADRGPSQLFVSPDGKFALVNTMGSFAAERGAVRPVSTELVDLSTRSSRVMFDMASTPAFASDGKTVYFWKYHYQPDGKSTSWVTKYDLAAGKEIKAVTSPGVAFRGGPTVSPDGKWLAIVEQKEKPLSVALLILSADTLEEVARIPGPAKSDRSTNFSPVQFTPHGKSLITRSNGPILVWDVGTRKVERSIEVPDFLTSRIAISPDGKQLALAGLPRFDISRVSLNPEAADLPQSRLVVVSLEDAKSKPQTLNLPQGMAGGIAFSPDGKMVAVGGHGGVHLVDVAMQQKK